MHDPGPTADAPATAPRLPALLLGAALVALVVAVYVRVPTFGFVNLDDRFYVRENAHVLRGLTADGFAWAFTTFEQANWHPLTWLSHMLDATLFGPGPAGPHAVNVGIHVANTLLLFAGLRTATGATWRSAIVAALFGVHPLHVESVAWISERKDVLCALLAFLSAGAWLRWTRTGGRGAYVLSLALFAASLLAKPMSVTFPFALLLADAWPLRRAGTGGRPWRALVLEKVPFLVLSAASAVVTFAAQSTAAVAGVEHLPVGSRVANAVVAYATYLVRTVWPADLAVLYPHPTFAGGAHAAWKVAAAAALLVAVSAAAWRARRTRPWLAWGWCWYLGTLVPVIGLVQVGLQATADRYTYVPLVGVFVAAAWAGAEFADRARIPAAVRAGFAGAVVLALAVTAFAQTGHWADSVRLNRRAVEATDRNAVAWAGLGDAHLERGDADAAVAAYERALEIDPRREVTRGHLECGLGVVAGRAGRHEDAVAHFERAVALAPGDAVTWFNLGAARGNLGRHADAADAFERALAIRPDDVRSLAGLATARIRLGDRARALDAAARLRSVDPARAAPLLDRARALPGR